MFQHQKSLLFTIGFFLTFNLFAQSSDEYKISVAFPAGYAIGDYVEFVNANPIGAGASGFYQISISYTRSNMAAAATHVAAVSHSNPNLWRETGRINSNPYVGQITNFTVDCNTQYGNPRFRIRAIGTHGETDQPLIVNIKVTSVNINSSFAPIDVRGNDVSVLGFLPMTSDWSLYVGDVFSANGASLAIKAIQNGNVGIGTSTPSAKLDIVGDIYIDNLDYHSDNALRIREGSNDAYGAFFKYGLNDLLTIGTRNTGTDYVAIQVPRGSLNTTFNGNVGIGTVNPQHKLDVFGTIRAREVKVNLDGADFVFEDGYKLMTLNELEKFVKQKKHLPEIDPAKEMQENGSNLGSLSVQLLQKIEELTLHAIEQNKAIMELQQELKNLKQNKKI